MHATKLKIMIVDDEMLIRKLIRMRVDWESLGMEIVAEAASAGEALALLETEQPDIIFTDICMPAMDGITFSRMVMERRPSTRIVIVTGYDEFEYAKSCIKLGVADFIMKPIKAEELEQVATQQKKKILEERQADSKLEELRTQLTVMLPSIQEKALFSLVMGHDLHDVESQALTSVQTLLQDADGFEVAIVEIEDSQSDVVHPAKQQQLFSKALSIVRATFRNDEQVHVLPDGTSRIIILNGNAQVDMAECCEIIKTQLLNQCRCHLSIGIGCKVKSTGQIPESCQAAQKALSHRIIMGWNHIVHCNEIADKDNDKLPGRDDRMNQISICIRSDMPDKALLLVREVLDTLLSGKDNQLALLRREALDIVILCGQIWSERHPEGTTPWPETTHPYDKVLEIDNLPDMIGYLEGIIREVAQACRSNQQSPSVRLIEQVLQHIQDHLDDASLSLSGTASVFYISQSHLSRLFRRETGKSFIEHVTQERMKKAFRLVTESDMKSFQIGKLVGIPDPHYFSILFKKHAGMSVKECRNR